MNLRIINTVLLIFMTIVVVTFFAGIIYNSMFKKRGMLAKVNNPQHDYHGEFVIIHNRIRKQFFIVKLYLKEDARPFLIDKKDLLFK